jgi:hypothetical protein
MSKLFQFAGTSLINGKVSFRCAQEMKSRAAMLQKNGHTDLNFVELPVQMSKLHGAKFLRQYASDNYSAEEMAAIEGYIANHDDGTEVLIEWTQPVVEEGVSTDADVTSEEGELEAA